MRSTVFFSHSVETVYQELICSLFSEHRKMQFPSPKQIKTKSVTIIYLRNFRQYVIICQVSNSGAQLSSKTLVESSVSIHHTSKQTGNKS